MENMSLLVLPFECMGCLAAPARKTSLARSETFVRQYATVFTGECIQDISEQNYARHGSVQQV